MNKLNGAGNANAASCVSSGKVDKNSSWSFSAEDGNAMLGPNGDDWANYSKWHLGIDNAEKPDVKAHYKYPFGKNGKVYRSGLIAAESRAAANGDAAIAAAAKRHLDKIDGKELKPENNYRPEIEERALVRLGEKALEPQRAYATFEIKGIVEEDDGEMTLEVIASTPCTDRMGDIVEPMGAVFDAPFPFLYQHDSKMPIGWVTQAKPNSNGIPATVKLAGKGIAKFIDDAKALIKAGLVRAVSIGFRALDWKWIDETDWNNMGIHFLQWEWMELSAVTIPANMQATIQTIKSYDLKRDSLAASGIPATRSTVVRLNDPPGASGKAILTSTTTKGNGTMKTFAEQIAAFEAKRSASAARMTELMKTAGEETRSLTKEESEEYETLKAEVEGCDEHIVRLKDHQKLMTKEPVEPEKAGGAGPTSQENNGGERRPAAGDGVIHGFRNNQNLPKGIAFTRYVMALADAKGNVDQAIERATTDWKSSTPEVLEALKSYKRFGPKQMDRLMKAAVAAGTGTDATWAGPLVPLMPMASEFVEFLYPMTIVGRLQGLRMVPFNIKVPRQTAGAASSKWVGEATPKPISKLAFDAISLGYSKISTIVVLTEELVRYSTPSAELLCRNDLAEAITKFMDGQFINPDVAAAVNVSPASVTHGATKINATGTTLDSVTTDVASIFGEFSTHNVPLAGAVWVFNPRTSTALGMIRSPLGVFAFPDIGVDGGKFFGFPVISSNNVPISAVSANETIGVLLKPSEILVADDGAINVDMSNEASLEMSDAPGGGATSLVSLWQNDMIGLRAERFINWLPRRDHAVAVWDGLRL